MSMTTTKEQDQIDDTIDFIDITKNGTKAQVNRQNTIVKADNKENLAKFLGVRIENHVIFGPGFYSRIQVDYPLLELVEKGLKLSLPVRILYKHERILIAEYNDFVIGVAPAI